MKLAALMPACGMPWEQFQEMSGVPSSEMKELARFNWLKRFEVGDEDWVSTHSVVAEIVNADKPPSMGDEACRGFVLAMGDWLSGGMRDRTPIEVLRAADTAARSAELALREQTDEGTSRIVVPYIYALDVAGRLERALAAAERVDPSRTGPPTMALVDLEAAVARAGMLKQSEDGAKDVIARLERYRPDDRISLSRAHELLASLYISNMDLKSAREQLEAAVNVLDEQSAETNRGISILINLAMVDMASGDSEEATEALALAMEMYEEDPSKECAGLGMLCDFLDGIDENDPGSEQDMIQAFMESVIQNRMEQLPDGHPHIAFMCLSQASEKVRRGDFDGAQELIDKAKAAASKNYGPGSAIDLMVKRAQLELCYESGRDCTAARKEFEESMAAADPGNREAIDYCVSEKCREAGRLLESGSDEAAVKIAEEAVGYAFDRADGLFLAGRLGMVARVFYEAADAEPDRQRVVRLYAEAERIWERALRIDYTGFEARKAEVLIALGKIRVEMWDMDSAEDHLIEAAKLNQDVDDPVLSAARVFRFIGNNFLEGGKLEQASSCFRRAMGMPEDELDMEENAAICIAYLALCELEAGNDIAFRGLALDALGLMENTPMDDDDAFCLCVKLAGLFPEREDVAERFRDLASEWMDERWADYTRSQGASVREFALEKDLRRAVEPDDLAIYPVDLPDGVGGDHLLRRPDAADLPEGLRHLLEGLVCEVQPQLPIEAAVLVAYPIGLAGDHVSMIIHAGV